MDKNELDILKNITDFGKNLENIDKKINIIKNISNDDFYKNLLNHSSKSLNKNCKRTEIINKYINDLYKGSDTIYKFKTKIIEAVNLDDLKLNTITEEEIKITNTNKNYNFGIIDNTELINTINSLKQIKRKNKDNSLLYFENIIQVKTLEEKFKNKPYQPPKKIDNDDNKIDLLFYNLQQIINKKKLIDDLYKEEFSIVSKGGGNKFNINIKNNFFMLKENIINVLDTYNNLSRYNQVVKMEEEIKNDIDFYKYVILYYKELLLYSLSDYVTNYRDVFDLLTIDNELLKKITVLNNNQIQQILNKYNFEDNKTYLVLTNNLELAYLRGFIIFVTNK
jgi:hypothetical protein